MVISGSKILQKFERVLLGLTADGHIRDQELKDLARRVQQIELRSGDIHAWGFWNGLKRFIWRR